MVGSSALLYYYDLTAEEEEEKNVFLFANIINNPTVFSLPPQTARAKMKEKNAGTVLPFGVRDAAYALIY